MKNSNDTIWNQTCDLPACSAVPQPTAPAVRREVLYNFVNEFGIPMKLANLIKMCLNETYGRVRVVKHSSDMLPVRNGLKQGDALSPLIFNCALDYAIRRFLVNQDGLKLNGTHQLLVYTYYVNTFVGSVHTM